jgi:hypothetical protein
MTRITIEVTDRQKKQMKILAAVNDLTLKDYILDMTIRKEANQKTLESFDDYDQGNNLKYHKNIRDLMQDLKE